MTRSTSGIPGGTRRGNRARRRWGIAAGAWLVWLWIDRGAAAQAQLPPTPPSAPAPSSPSSPSSAIAQEPPVDANEPAPSPDQPPPSPYRFGLSERLGEGRSTGIGLPSWWSVAGGVQGSCAGCGPAAIAPPVTPNAPWTVRGSLSLERGGNQFSIGVVGRRGHRLPLYLAQPLGVTRDVTPAVSGMTDMAQSEIRWVVTTGAQRLLKRTAGRKTLTLVGDILVPVGPERAVLSNPGAPVPRSRAARVGLSFGF